MRRSFASLEAVGETGVQVAESKEVQAIGGETGSNRLPREVDRGNDGAASVALVGWHRRRQLRDPPAMTGPTAAGSDSDDGGL